MDFTLSEEQELLQETVRSFVENECPAATVREIFDGDRSQEPALWKGLCEMGIAGLALPEEHGGAGLALLDLALVSEELGRGCVPVPFLGHALAGLAIALGGSDAQKERWLPKLAAGEVQGSVALGEADGAWLPEQWTAKLEGGRISGEKHFVPHGNDADLVVVGTAGGGLAIVETAGDGVALEEAPAPDRGRRLACLRLDGAAAEALPGDVAQRVVDAGLVLLTADAFGAGWKLVRMTAEYANTRQQFGQVIGQFQGLKHQIANMALDIDPMKGLWWYAAYAFDAEPENATRAAAVAKAHITDRAQQAARDAVECHGGIGFTWECDVQIWFKRIMLDRLFLGGPVLHRERAAVLGGW